MMRFVVLVASIGGFLFGYTTSVISGALLFVAKEFSLTPLQEGNLVSIILIGALIGAAFAGTIADRLGRKKTLLIASLVFVIGSWASMIAHHFDSLLLGRAITGLAAGIVSMTGPLYLAEVSPPSKRGKYVSMNQLAITIGILLAYGCNSYFSETAAWRAMFGLALLPAGLQLFALLFVPESPSWLLGKHQPQKAERAFKLIRSQRDWKAHCDEMMQSAVAKGGRGWKALMKPALRIPLLIGCLLSIFQQITGINAVIYYAPKIFQMAGFSSAVTAIFATLGIGVINVATTLFSVYLIDRIGRRKLLLFGTAGMIVSLVILSIAFFTEAKAIDMIAVGSLMAYVAFFAIGLGPITWLIISEIYPLHVRGRAMGIATFANWLFNYFVALTFLDLIVGLGTGGTFLLYAFIGLLALVFAYYFIPETKGKSLDQIQQALLKKS